MIAIIGRALMSVVLLLNASGVFALAAKVAPEPEKSKAPIAKSEASSYRFNVDDSLSIFVFPSQELSRELTVQTDGTVNMPFIGAVSVVGMTAEDAARRMEELLSKYVTAPQVGITVKKFSFRRVSVLGEVRYPGFYDYYDGLKMLDLISLAQGLADYPRMDKVIIFRRSTTPQTSEVVNIEPLMQGNLEYNYDLRSGDVVFIPRQKIYRSAKWLSDNFVPWMTLLTFGITVALLAKK